MRQLPRPRRASTLPTTVTDRTQRAAEWLDRHILSDEVKALPHAEASYNSRSRNDAPVCLEGTRVLVLNDILDWIRSKGHHIYILRGIAGSGKTTIAQTVATLAAKQQCLSASFFFSKYEVGRNSSQVFFPTLAYQLAQFSSELEPRIKKVLKQSPDAPSKTIVEQLEKLIIGPLQGVSIRHGRPTLVVLDALDECTAVEGEEILQLLVHAAPQLPPNLKFFITLRPESQFISTLDTPRTRQMVLHDIEGAVVQEDIRRYLRHELSRKEVQRATGLEWQIREEDLEILVRMAGCLFIAASTAQKFIKDSIRSDPRHQLGILLRVQGQDSSDLSPNKTLDHTYLEILKAAVPLSHSCANIIRRFQCVIGSVIVLQHPLPISSLANLLDMDITACQAALRHLHSVIVFGSYDQAPRIYHPSFPDFITDRCTDTRFRIKLKDHHERIANMCLDTMNRLLRRNMCQLTLPHRYMKNSEIPDLTAKIKTYIPVELEYACTYWAMHLSKAVFRDEGIRKLEAFALKHLLPWLEVLSLTGRLEHAYPALGHAKQYLMANSGAGVVLAVLDDAARLLMGSYEILKTAAMHVYYSALPFAPIECALFPMYEYEAGESMEVLRGRESSWNPTLAVLVGHSDKLNAVVFSLDGSHLASASQDNTVRLWDGVTGAEVAALEGHSGAVESIAFSPDGSRLASASRDKTVRLWDGVKRAMVMELQGHSDEVNSVVFSPDGSHLASASRDKSIRLWNVATGALVVKLEGHSGCVNSVAFSPDGSRLASASVDKTVRMWDLVTGAVVVLEGHSGWVNAVVFSHDGARLASASGDNTARLWDGVTGAKIAELKGHSYPVNSIMFSPNGTRLVSASDDNTVRLWDGVTRARVAELKGHSSCVNSVVFSPNGNHIASASDDKTVILWNGVTGGLVGKLEGHSDQVNFVAFSPDSSRLASSSHDKTVRLWDGTAKVASVKREGHSGCINDVVFSQDGILLASASQDKTVRLWNSMNGAVAAELKGHSKPVNSVAFSADGTRIASASDDRTVVLWNRVDKAAIARLEGHSSFVISIVFSPSGTHLASASYDKTVRLWDTATGAAVAELEADPSWVYSSWVYSNSVNSVVFSPNGTRLVSAHDKTVRLWDGVTGAVVARLEAQPSSNLSNPVYSSSVNSVVFSPDGGRLATSYGKTVRLWDGVTGTVIAPLEGHSMPVTSVAFSPDGARLASASDDKTVVLWDGITGTFIARYMSWSIPHVFRLDNRINILPLNSSERLTTPEDRSDLLSTSSIHAESVILEFNEDAKCYTLSGLWKEADQTLSKICLCWFPRSLVKGKVTQIGTRIALGLGDGRVLIFSTGRLQLT